MGLPAHEEISSKRHPRSGSWRIGGAGAAGVCAVAAFASSHRRAATARRATAVLTRPVELTTGTKVQWNGKPGTVSFIGKTKFAAGDWVGVTLDSAEGMHNGTVMGVSYFECKPRCGVFTQAAQLTVNGATPAPAAAVAVELPVGGATPAPAPAAVAPAPAPAAAVAVAPMPQEADEAVLELGQRVHWNGLEGTVSYMGTTRFAPGEWVGIALDVAKGMHNG